MEFLKQLPTRGIITSPAFNFESAPNNKTYVSLKEGCQIGNPPQHLKACDSAFMLAKALASQDILSDNSQNQSQGARAGAGTSKTAGQGQTSGLQDKAGSGKRKNGDCSNNNKKQKQNPDQVGQRRSKRKQNEVEQNKIYVENCDGPSSSKRPKRGVYNRCLVEEEIVEGQDESIKGGLKEEEQIIYTEAQLQAKTNKELQDILKCMGQGVRGRKHELVQRILQAQMLD